MALSYPANTVHARRPPHVWPPAVGIALLAAAVVCWPRARPLPSEHQVRDTVRRILARSEYQVPPETVLHRLLDLFWRVVARLIEWLLKPLEWLVDRMSRVAPEMSPSARWLVVGVLTFLLVLLLLHIFYLLAGSFDTGRRRRAARAAGVAHLDPSSLLADARRLAMAGRYRDAIRALYLAALLRLDRAEIVSYDPARTNWEYASAVAGAPIAADFRELTRIADRAMYSAAPVGPDDFSRAERLFSRLGVPGE